MSYLDVNSSIQTSLNNITTNVTNNTNNISALQTRLTTDESSINTNTSNITNNTNSLTILNNNYKVNADNTLPYITAQLSRNNGFIINDSEVLPTTLGSTNMMESLTQNVGSNQYYLNSYMYRHTNGTGWQNASVRIANQVDTTTTGYIEFNPPNYLYGVGIYGGTTTGKYGLTIATDGKVNVNTSNSLGLDTNTSNIHCNDLYFNYTDPILGNNTSALSQRWTAMYQTLQNNIDISTTNSANITTLQNQIVNLTALLNTLQLSFVKAYGHWNGSSWDVGSQFIAASTITTVSGLYGLKFVLNIDTTYVQGVVVATPDGANGGYTCEAKYLGRTTIGTLQTDYVGIIVQMYNGGSQPSTQSTMSFYYILI